MASGEVSNMKVVENDSGQSESIRRTVCGLRTVRRSTIVYRRTTDRRRLRLTMYLPPPLL